MAEPFKAAKTDTNSITILSIGERPDNAKQECTKTRNHL